MANRRKIDQYRKTVLIDPFWNEVLLLMHFNGPNGGTVFTDSSKYAHVISRINSTIANSTVASKFNGSSTRFNGGSIGSGNRLQGAATDVFSIGSSDFTVEAWVNTDAANPSNPMFFTNKDVSSGGSSLYTLMANTAMNQYIELSSGTQDSVTGASFPSMVGNWAHACVVREGDNFRRYHNGRLYGSPIITPAGFSIRPVSGNFAVGGHDTASAFPAYNGYIAELRITKACRYFGTNSTTNWSNFAEPIAPWPEG